MFARVKQWLLLEIFENEEDRQVARLLLATLLGLLAICSLALLDGIFAGIPLAAWIGALGILSQGLALVLLASRRLTASGVVLGCSSIILITLVAMRGAGLHDIIVVAYPVVIVFSCLTLKHLWSLAIFLLAVLAAAWLVWGPGLLPVLFPVSTTSPLTAFLGLLATLTDFLGLLIILTVAFLIPTLQAGNIRRLLQKAQQEIVQRKQMEEKLRFMGTHDILTGAYNRMFLDGELIRLEHSRDFPITIILSDMDNLKDTNDRFGHDAGDELIKRACAVLHSSIREGDILARIGGDEFAVLLPGTGEETAGEILARIRNKIKEMNTTHPDLTVRLSLGASTTERGNLEKTFQQADRNMYADKAARKLQADTVPLTKKPDR